MASKATKMADFKRHILHMVTRLIETENVKSEVRIDL